MQMKKKRKNREGLFYQFMPLISNPGGFFSELGIVQKGNPEVNFISIKSLTLSHSQSAFCSFLFIESMQS